MVSKTDGFTDPSAGVETADTAPAAVSACLPDSPTSPIR
jgi:hypothetical protein